MISEIRKNLNKHEKILEGFKNKVFSDKIKIQNENNLNKNDPLNEISSKTLKIKDNINSAININKQNDLSPPKNFLSKTDKKIDEVLNRANYAIFENPRKDEIINSKKNLSSGEQVKKIIQENSKNKFNDLNDSEKVSDLIKKYETIDQNNKNPDKENFDKNRSYLEKLKSDHQINNSNLNKIIEKNNSLIENLKNKYLNNIKNSNESNNYNYSNDIKFPIQKSYKENISNILSSSGNSIPIDNNNINFIDNSKFTKNLNSASSLHTNRKIFEDDLEFDNKDTINNINILRMRYLNDEKPKSNIDLNKLLQNNDNLVNIQNSLIKGESNLPLSRNPQVNSILNKYKSKATSSYSAEICSENKNDLYLFNDYVNMQREENKHKENLNKGLTFNDKLEDANKKIENINFTFQKNGNDIFGLNNKESEEQKNKRLNAEESILNKILNKNIEKEKKEIFENEKSKFDFIFKNKENIHNLLFKFKLKEKFCLDESKAEENLNKNYDDNTKGKKGFINKINFIEEKLNRIESLINFEENELSKNNKNTENKIELNLRNRSNNDNEIYQIKNTSENDNSDYGENFTLGNMNFKNNDVKNCKKSVFSDLNKNEDFTTDDEKLSNNILSFAQNIRNLKELKEKNNSLLEDLESKNKAKKKDLNIPSCKKSKENKSNVSDNDYSDKYDSDNTISVLNNNIVNIGSSINDPNDQKSFVTKKILDNLIETENIFKNNKDFIDEEIEREKKNINNNFKKSLADGNTNISAINNMTLSYSISSNEKSDEENQEQEEEYYLKKGRNYEAGYMSNPSDDENYEINYNNNENINEAQNPQINNPEDYGDKSNENISYDKISGKSLKNIKSRSKSKPAKNLISFDEFLNAE